MEYRAIVIGSSAGGLQALTAILEELPVDYPIPIVVTQHRANVPTDLLEEILQYKCKIKIKQADEKESIQAGVVYTAPPGYHLLVEADGTFSLSIDVPEKFSVPSIDALFETAAVAYRNRLIGIILTGANDDGSNGMRMIKKYKGMTIAQNPVEATFPYMPKSAIETGTVDKVLKLTEIRKFILGLSSSYKNGKI
jgi:two-component system chemotaxis response regulator CheB